MRIEADPEWPAIPAVVAQLINALRGYPRRETQMAQRKKEEVRDAILEAAFRLFSEHGYNDTSLPAVAREAGISTANVYRYFNSKLDLLFTLYEPWMTERLDKLEVALKKIKSPTERVERLLMALWRDLPREDNGFTNNLIQALSTGRGENYSPRLREQIQARVGHWIADALGLTSKESQIVVGVLLMAFDGFALNVHLAHGMGCNAETVRLFAAMLSRTVEIGR